VVYVVAGFLDKSIGSWKREAGLADGRFVQHRFLTKRPADVRAIACCSSLGMVIFGDSKGNLFTWNLAQPGSKVVRLTGCKQASDIASLECCPISCHGIVAVGCRDGRLVACDFLNDDIVYEFKGHSKEVMSVKWTACPGNVDRFGSRDATLFASSSQDGHIYAHLVTFDLRKKENCEGSGCIMNVVGSKEIILDKLSQKMSNRFWIALAWLPIYTPSTFDPREYHLLYSSYNGKVVVWDAKRLMDSSAASMHDVKLPNGHSRAIFSLHCSRISNRAMKVISIGMDRICSVWNLSSGDVACKSALMSAKIEHQILGFGSHPVCLALRPQENFKSSMMAVGCGDATIRLVEFDESQDILSDSLMGLVWKGIPAPVRSIAWNQQGEVVAFGCEDGSIGMFDAGTREVCLAEIRHPLPVTSLVWQMGDGGGNLLSVSNDGTVLAWPDADSFLHETKFPIKSTRMQDFSEKQSVTCTSPIINLTQSAGGFALGLRDGDLIVIDGTSLNISWKMDPINSLSPVTMVACFEDNAVALLHNNGAVRLMKHSVEGTKLVGSTNLPTNAVPTVMKLFKIPWDGKYLIAIGFEDGKVELYVSQEQPYNSTFDLKQLNAILKGHSGPVLGLSWLYKNTLKVPLLASSSQDQSLRLWTIPANIIQAATNSIRNPSPEGCQIDYLGEKLVKVHISTINNRNYTTKSKDEGLSSAAIKGKGKFGTVLLQHIFPSEDTEAHIGKERILQTLTFLIKSFKSRLHGDAETEDLCASITRHAVGLLPHVPLTREAADTFLEQIASSYEAPKSPDSLIQRRSLHRSAALRLWQGDVGGAIDTLVTHGALTSDFVNFAAAAGRETWVAVVQAYVSQLEKSGDFHMAVLYLLSIGEDIDACLLYERHGMLRESAFLSIARLPAQHAVGIRLRKAYAHALRARDHWYYSAALFISLECWDEALDALQKSQDPLLASTIEKVIFET